VAFNQEVSDLLGTTRVARVSHQTGHRGGRTVSGDDIAILRPEEIRQLPIRQALVIAENGKPIIAKLFRCLDGPSGRQLLADQHCLREQLTTNRQLVVTAEARTTAALVEADRLGFVEHNTQAPIQPTAGGARRTPGANQ